MIEQKPITEILQIADTCSWLNFRDIDKQTLMGGSPFKPKDVTLLKWYKRRVQWMQDNNPTNSTLRQTANYLYSLCGGRNAAIAQNIIQQQGGSVIYDPSTGQLLNGLLFQDLEYEVCGSGSPLSAGQTVYTITDSRIIAGTLDVHVDGLLLPVDESDRFSYSVVYTSTTIEITFNQPLICEQIVRFKYVKGGQVSGSVTKSLQPTIFTIPAYGVTSFTISALINIPKEDIVMVFRGNFPVRLIDGATSDMNQMQYTSSTGTFTYPSGDISTGDQTFSIVYMV